MSETVTFSLDDAVMLHRMCGVHDQNIKYLMTLFSSDVYVRGSDVVIVTDDNKKQCLFEKLCQELRSYIQWGYELEKSLIQSLYNRLITEERTREVSPQPIISLQGVSKDIFPRTQNQARFLHAMHHATLTFSIGPAGTGKTFLAVAQGLSSVLKKQYRRLILTRPVVEAGENLGFLPGDLQEKIQPYLHPFFDVINHVLPDHLALKLQEQQVIEIAPLAYMRGRGLDNCFVILDEAQNTTTEQIKLFVTRLGEQSKAVVTGDPTQIDRVPKSKSGLLHAMHILAKVEGVHSVHFDTSDVVRSEFVQRVVEAYESSS